MDHVALIIPTYRHFAYAQLAVESAARTPGVVVMVIDDGSPDWPGERIVRGWLPPTVPFVIQRYDGHAGSLSRSWNRGLHLARDMGTPYVVCANADVVFAEGWWEPVRELLYSFDFVGPLTNAPGHCNGQNVTRYLPGYEVDDDPDMINEIQSRLERAAHPHLSRGQFNGFCIAGRTASFLRVGGTPGEVFDPRRPLAGNEDDFFCRAKTLGLRGAICPTSFVFHYRSVSRGLKGKRLDRGHTRLAGCTGCGG